MSDLTETQEEFLWFLRISGVNGHFSIILCTRFRLDQINCQTGENRLKWLRKLLILGKWTL